MNYRYRLEPYRPGGTNRYVCPHCGRKKCFTRYIDTETGEYLDESCGRCNHVSSCGYDYTPSQLYRNYPQLRPNDSWRHPDINGHVSVLARKEQPFQQPQEYVQTEFYDFAWVEKATERTSAFRTWFEGLPFNKELMATVLYEYFVGGTSDDVVVNGVNHGPAAVFWMIDEQLRVHDAKCIAYHPDGHRVDGWANFLRSACEKKKTGPQLAQTEKVLFGLHLLNYYPAKPVCIVESEKSALVCACRYPQYLWMATGGCGGLSKQKLRPLMDRTLVVIPDSGEYEKWSKRMKESGHKHYKVINDLEVYPPNTDIADLILEELCNS